MTLVDTGDGTMTGGRCGGSREYLGDETFCFTYGDGVADVDITALLAIHRRGGTLATVTAVQPPGRFGALGPARAKPSRFKEKPIGDSGWVNGGFFVLQPAVLDYIAGDDTVFESALSRSARAGRAADGLSRIPGFWHPMDTLRDKAQLEALWNSGNAPWRIWSEPPARPAAGPARVRRGRSLTDLWPAPARTAP